MVHRICTRNSIIVTLSLSTKILLRITFVITFNFLFYFNEIYPNIPIHKFVIDLLRKHNFNSYLSSKTVILSCYKIYLLFDLKRIINQNNNDFINIDK
jgi:hypothetical protein